MTQDLIGYPTLVERAMLCVLREALVMVAESGLPGLHHFFITFRTTDSDVTISDTLVARYPEEMTIVLENQFWGLEVNDDDFTVGLSFGGSRELLTIPFSAVTAFVDPSVKFGLQFGDQAGPVIAADNAGEEALIAAAESEDENADDGKAAPMDFASGDGTVVTLDSFRKK
jgi:hypothetical protein